MKKNLKGIHVWWTKPAMKKMVNYYMPDHQLITLMLSALYWKKYYGEIVLYTDKRMVEFLKKTGIYDLHLWDEINTDIVENIPNVINPYIYWAGAKLFVAKELKPPFVMIDVDLYFEKYYEFDYNMDLIFFHFEDMIYPHYPPPKLFIKEYPNINMNIPKYATNVAVLFINNKKLLEEYTYHAIKFMCNKHHNNIKDFDDFYVRILFVEQVLLPIILHNSDNNYKTKPIIKDIYITLNNAEQQFVRNKYGESNIYSEILDKINHVWGFKNNINTMAKSYFNFMVEHIKKLKNYPTAYDTFLNARKIIDEINDINNYKKKFDL